MLKTPKLCKQVKLVKGTDLTSVVKRVNKFLMVRESKDVHDVSWFKEDRVFSCFITHVEKVETKIKENCDERN